MIRRKVRGQFTIKISYDGSGAREITIEGYLVRIAL